MYNWLKRRKYKHRPEESSKLQERPKWRKPIKNFPWAETICVLWATAIISFTMFGIHALDNRIEHVEHILDALEETSTDKPISPELPVETEASMDTLIESWEEPETTAVDIYTEPETTAVDVPKEPEVTYTEPETPATDATTTDIPNVENVGGKTILGCFKITGYCYQCNGSWGTKSASGMPLVAGQSCAMNRGDMADNNIQYGDWIVVESYGCVQVVDCGCSSGTIDIFIGEHGEAENAITGWSVVIK